MQLARKRKPVDSKSTDFMIGRDDASAVQGDPTVSILSPEALAAAFQRCRPMLLYIAIQRTRSPSNAEDMVQQAFLQAWKSRASFRGQARLSTWLTRILINEIHQVQRRAEHKALEYTDEPVTLENQRARAGFFPSTQSAEAALLLQERLNVLRKAVRALPGRYRSVLSLEVYEEKTTEEIGVELGLSLAAVKSRKLRARLEVQRRLKSAHASRKSSPGA